MLPMLMARIEFTPRGAGGGPPWPSRTPFFPPKPLGPGVVWVLEEVRRDAREEEGTRGPSRGGGRNAGVSLFPSLPLSLHPSLPPGPTGDRRCRHVAGAARGGGGARRRRRRLAEASGPLPWRAGSPGGSAALPGSARPAGAAGPGEGAGGSLPVLARSRAAQAGYVGRRQGVPEGTPPVAAPLCFSLLLLCKGAEGKGLLRNSPGEIKHTSRLLTTLRRGKVTRRLGCDIQRRPFPLQEETSGLIFPPLPRPQRQVAEAGYHLGN